MKNKEDLSKVDEAKNGLNEKEREILIRILTMRIPYDKINKTDKIFMKNSVIISTQVYNSYGKVNIDSDMSDFAVAFYEILYKDILKEAKIRRDNVSNEEEVNILNDDGTTINKNFIGDTMNSFKTIANKYIRFYDLGNNVEYNTPISELPSIEIKRLRRMYDCLANFWMIPMEIGRGIISKHAKYEKNGRKDYMDDYLIYVKNNWNGLNQDENVGKYFELFDDFDDFCKQHYIPLEYVPSNAEQETTHTINDMINFIDKRAELIADGDKASDLFDYFKDIGLIEYNKTP